MSKIDDLITIVIDLVGTLEQGDTDNHDNETGDDHDHTTFCECDRRTLQKTIEKLEALKNG